MIAQSLVTNDSRRRYPELYQFFAGYFYQGWAEDYRWDTTEPSFKPVVRHFRAVNPQSLVHTVRDQLTHLALSSNSSEDTIAKTLAELGSAFDPGSEGLTNIEWIENIVNVLSESASTAVVLRERT